MIFQPSATPEEAAAIIAALGALPQGNGDVAKRPTTPAWRRAARESETSFDELRARQNLRRVR